MRKQAIEVIENEVMDFIRRIIMSEKRNGRLDRSAFVILRQLSTHGPAGVKTLADELHLDISTISRQAAALVEKGYVDKMPNPRDGRAYFYRITDLGTKELNENRQRQVDRLTKVLEGWSDEECITFGQLLKKYNQTVNKRKS